MNLVPVADEREHQEKKRDQQQPRGFRRIHRLPVMLLLRMIVLIWGGHAAIVAPGLHGTATPLLGQPGWRTDRANPFKEASVPSATLRRSWPFRKATAELSVSEFSSSI
jgi:hypothetical protein